VRAELEELLLDRYAPIFSGLHKRVWRDVPGSAFGCGDGWFQIIDCLCGEISHYTANPKVPPVSAVQVKEKFGTLRFRYRGGDAFVEGLVRMAEGVSEHVCELCGAPGGRTAEGSISTFCRGQGSSPEFVLPQDVGRASTRFQLPTQPRNPGWRHLVRAFEETVDFNIRHTNIPHFAVDAVIETEALTLRRVGGDVRDGAQGMLRMVEAFSLRCDQRTGRRTSALDKNAGMSNTKLCPFSKWPTT